MLPQVDELHFGHVLLTGVVAFVASGGVWLLWSIVRDVKQVAEQED